MRGVEARRGHDMEAPTHRSAMRRFRDAARTCAVWVAGHEAWLLLIVVPILVIAPSPLLPSWLVALALLAIPVPFLTRRIAYGRFSISTPVDVPLLLLLAMHAVALAVTVDMGLTMLVIKRTALAVAIFFFLVNNIRNQENVTGAAIILVGMGLLMAAVGLLGTNWSTGKLAFLQEIYRRLPHFVSAALNAAGFNANIVGGGLAMIVPVAFGLAAGHHGWVRVLALIASAFLLSVVVLSQSRGALLGLAIALGIMTVAANRRLLLLVPLAVAGIMLILWRFGPQTFTALLLPMDAAGGTLASRLELWNRATYMIQDFPFTGIGAGTFSRPACALSALPGSA